MSPESFTLLKDGATVTTGPLALVAPQAAKLSREHNTNRLVVIDHQDNAARIVTQPSAVQARWEPALELFPSLTEAPAWIQRLQRLLDEVAQPN